MYITPKFSSKERGLVVRQNGEMQLLSVTAEVEAKNPQLHGALSFAA
jgi:hypothetical protein